MVQLERLSWGEAVVIENRSQRTVWRRKGQLVASWLCGERVGEDAGPCTEPGFGKALTHCSSVEGREGRREGGLEGWMSGERERWVPVRP